MRLIYEPPIDRCVKGSMHRSVGIRMFLGLPDPVQLVQGMDPSITKQK